MLLKEKLYFFFGRRTEAQILILVTDSIFWKTQWGDYAIFSHGSNHSAGVAIFFNKFKGNVLESIRSDNGRWIILTVKLDNSTLINMDLMFEYTI